MVKDEGIHDSEIEQVAVVPTAMVPDPLFSPDRTTVAYVGSDRGVGPVTDWAV